MRTYHFVHCLTTAVTIACAGTVSAANTNMSDKAYQAIISNPASAEVKSIDLSHLFGSSAAVSKTAKISTQATMSVALDGEKSVEVMKLRSQTTNDGIEIWEGLITDSASMPFAKNTSDIVEDPMNAVILVKNGNKITGSIRKDGQLYKLLPLKNTNHVLVKIDESKMPPDHPAGVKNGVEVDHSSEKAPPLKHNNVMKAGIPSTAMATVITVGVVGTPAARAASGDFTGLVNLAVAETNQGYRNSGINIQMDLVRIGKTKFESTGDFSRDLESWKITNDGRWDFWPRERNRVKADVMILITNTDDSCGIAYVNASQSYAYGVVAQDCATGNYTFAHEIGHVQGALHDIANDPDTSPRAYAHGYQSPDNRWRTIMAYNCDDDDGCPRLNYWSNPAKTYQGQAMGNESRANNTRVLNETSSLVSGFR